MGDKTHAISYSSGIRGAVPMCSNTREKGRCFVSHPVNQLLRVHSGIKLSPLRAEERSDRISSTKFKVECVMFILSDSRASVIIQSMTESL